MKFLKKLLAEKPQASSGLLDEAKRLKASGKDKEALEACGQCLKAEPGNIDAHLLALQLIKENASLGFTPETFSRPYNNERLHKAYAARIQELQGAGKLEDALTLARTLCMLAPNKGECRIVAGILCLSLGRPDDAINIFEEGLEREPNNILFRAQYIKTILLSGFDRFDPKVRRRVGQFLKEPATVNLSFLSRIWLMLLNKDPAWTELLSAGDIKEYSAFRKWFDGKNFEKNLTDEWFLDGLRNCIVADIRIEQVLYFLRRTLLDYALEGGKAPAWAVPLGVALSEQCFVNEYVYEETDEETKKAATLAEKLEKSDDPSSLGLAAVAGYIPLFKLKLKKRPTDPALKMLIKQQIDEPLEELKIRKEIPAIGMIDDETSRRVREQYEEHPYPRWISFGTLPDETDEMVLSPADHIKPLNILVAGCATGHFPIRVCINYPYASVTGIDLSLTSLSYGERKAREMGVKNLQLYHCDILNVRKLEQKFDIIFSVGILHCMRDPEEGWKGLVDCIKPGGLMRLGFYPELERKHITDGRQFIFDNKIPGTNAGIRQMRRIIKDRPANDPIRKVTPFNDFYSTSMMRDLLFHVSEQVFTIPRIKKAHEDFGLEFIKFSPLMREELDRYRSMFPDDPNMTNLDHWDEYEHKYPDTFTGLYQFWSRKK